MITLIITFSATNLFLNVGLCYSLPLIEHSMRCYLIEYKTTFLISWALKSGPSRLASLVHYLPALWPAANQFPCLSLYTPSAKRGPLRLSHLRVMRTKWDQTRMTRLALWSTQQELCLLFILLLLFLPFGWEICSIPRLDLTVLCDALQRGREAVIEGGTSLNFRCRTELGSNSSSFHWWHNLGKAFTLSSLHSPPRIGTVTIMIQWAGACNAP